MPRTAILSRIAASLRWAEIDPLRTFLFVAVAAAVGIASLVTGQPPPAPVPVPVPPPPVAAPLCAFRTRLTIGDPDRAWTYLSCADGSLDPIWTVNGQPYQPWPLGAVDLFYDGNYHGGYTLPANAKPGPLVVNTGTQSVTLTVVAAPARAVTSVSAGATADQVTKAIAQAAGPKNQPVDITFQPGYYQWSNMVTLPAQTYVRAHGATFERVATNNYGGHYPAFYVGGPDVSIYGATVGSGVALDQALAANPAADGLVLSGCTFKNCNLGFYFTGALIRDCEFAGGGAVNGPGGLYWRCVFNGPSMQDPWQGWAGMDQFQQVDCIYNKTQRGPVFNAAGQSIESPFFAGVECHGIVRGNNGNECWLCEGGPCNHLVALHCRVLGCDSSTFDLDAGGAGTLVRDFVQEGGFGLVLLPYAPAVITNFTIQDSEFRRCGVYFGPQTSGCNVIDTSVIGFAPTRGNQTFPNSSYLCQSRTIAVWNQGDPGNTLTRVQIIGTPAGMTDSVGFAQVK